MFRVVIKQGVHNSGLSENQEVPKYQFVQKKMQLFILVCFNYHSISTHHPHILSGKNFYFLNLRVMQEHFTHNSRHDKISS